LVRPPDTGGRGMVRPAGRTDRGCCRPWIRSAPAGSGPGEEAPHGTTRAMGGSSRDILSPDIDGISGVRCQVLSGVREGIRLNDPPPPRPLTYRVGPAQP